MFTRSSISDESSSRRKSWLFFQGLLEHTAVEGQFGDKELEPTDFIGFEFGDADLLLSEIGFVLEGLPTIVGGGMPIAGLAAGLVGVQAGVEVGLELARRILAIWSGSGRFSHGSLPGSLPVVRFPLRLDQLLGGRPVERRAMSGFPPAHRLSPSLRGVPRRARPWRRWACRACPNFRTLRRSGQLSEGESFSISTTTVRVPSTASAGPVKSVAI